MGSATVGTIVITGVIVAVLALFLITIGLRLQRLSFTLGTIIVGLRAIREQTRPLGPVLDSVVGDVAAIEGALGEVLAEVGEPAVPAEAATTATPVEPEPAVVAVEEVDVMEFDGDGDGDGQYDADEEDEVVYEYEDERGAAVFEVPTRSRRGGSGFAEAMARAGERTPVRR